MSVRQAFKAVESADAAKQSRDEVQAAVRQHQRAEALGEVVRKLIVAEIYLKPFYQPGVMGSEGGNREEARNSLTDASIAVAEARPQFQN